MTEKLILHCFACSLNGTRLMKESEIAIIDEEKLNLPLRGDMFLPYLDEARGIPKRLAGEFFGEMKCLRHGGPPWNLTPEEAMEANKRGGPKTLLTNRGPIDFLKSDEVVFVSINKQSEKEANNMTLVPETDGRKFRYLKMGTPKLPYGGEPESVECPDCGRTFKNQRALIGHKKVHNPKRKR